MTVTATRYDVREVAVLELADDERLSLARLHQVVQHERFPHAPADPIELVERRLRHRPSTMQARDWLATLDGEVIGMGHVARWLGDGNPHWREAWIGVLPEHRRQGIASRLLRKIVDACADDPEIVIGSSTHEKAPGSDALPRKIGAKEGLANRTSELDLREVDRDMVREWAAIDPAGYRLVWIDGDVPDELMANVIVAYDTMNTAPRGDLDFGDWHTTEREVRDWERMRKANGGDRRLLLAIHDATGATAGFTEVGRNPMTPWVVGQNGTAVVPEHRQHGIGKWIKARMLERIFREWPEAQFVRTGNAYGNVPMLKINDTLGFRIVLSSMVWQATLAHAKRYLEERGL